MEWLKFHLCDDAASSKLSEEVKEVMEGKVIRGFNTKLNERGCDYLHVLQTPDEKTRIIMHIETRFSYPSDLGQHRAIFIDTHLKKKLEVLGRDYGGRTLVYFILSNYNLVVGDNHVLSREQGVPCIILPETLQKKRTVSF